MSRLSLFAIIVAAFAAGAATCGWLTGKPDSRPDPSPGISKSGSPEEPSVRLQSSSIVNDGKPLTDLTGILTFDELRKKIFSRLESIRDSKIEAIKEVFDSVWAKAGDAAVDQVLSRSFDLLYGSRKKTGTLVNPEGSEEQFRDLKERYLSSYLEFYDILFADSMGFIFYSVRGERDCFTFSAAQLIEEAEAAIRGGKSALVRNGVVFLRYRYYAPSAEPAAFFAVSRPGKGWIILQYPVNILNSLLVDSAELGNTGQVYIVNRDHLMLTNSRFHEGSTSLSLSIGTPAFASAMQGHTGLLEGVDYLGENVFSAFGHFAIGDNLWAIIADIRKSEVVTDYFLQNDSLFCGPVAQMAAATRPFIAGEDSFAPWTEAGRRGLEPVKVDMDEFSFAKPGEVVYTMGVSACTAVCIHLPGKFASLAHITPYDKIYGGRELTNRLKQVVMKILRHEIKLGEMTDLRVVIATTSAASLPNSVRKLAKYGFDVKQITFLHRPEARYVNLACDPARGEVVCHWKFGDETKSFSELAGKAPTLKKLMLAITESGKTASNNGTNGDGPPKNIMEVRQ